MIVIGENQIQESVKRIEETTFLEGFLDFYENCSEIFFFLLFTFLKHKI